MCEDFGTGYFTCYLVGINGIPASRGWRVRRLGRVTGECLAVREWPMDMSAWDGMYCI